MSSNCRICDSICFDLLALDFSKQMDEFGRNAIESI